jgi:hypothetical protein
MAKLKTLPVSHLDRLVRENKPVYVINTSSLPSGDKGMVIVNFFDGNRREFFKMPPTFIPMAITDSIPSRQLIESKDFKQCLLKGMLTLIEPASAEAFLATPDAQDEYESLVLSEHSAAAQHLNINKITTQRTKVAHTSGEGGSGPMQDISAVDTVSNKVRGLIESMVAETLTAKEVLTQLRRHQSALQPVDFSYVVANTTDAELKKWAKAGLAKSYEEESEYEDEDEEEQPRSKKLRREEKEPKLAAKKKETYGTEVFDFGKEKDEEVSDATRIRAEQEAMKNQAVYGQSQAEKEINDILSGKKEF